MAQFVTRIDDQLAADIDRLVSSGAVASRSAAVRVALVQLVDRYRREDIARRIVEGYTSKPQTEQEVGWSDMATVDMIAEEPW